MIGKSGHPYKIYSTIKGAVDDANTNRQSLGQTTSFFLNPGVHAVGTTIDLRAPTTGGYHFVGPQASLTNLTSFFTSRIDGTGSTNIFQSISGVGSWYTFENLQIELDNVANATGLDWQHGNYLRVVNCTFYGAHVDGWCININTGQAFLNTISGCVFLNAGVGIRFQNTAGVANEWLVTGCLFNIDTGIRGNTGTNIKVDGCYFRGLGNRGISIGESDFSAPWNWAIVGCHFVLLDEGIDIYGLVLPAESILISSSAFSQCTVAIECANTNTVQYGINIDGCQFFVVTGALIGIRGDATLTKNSRVANCTFNGYDSGNEIVDFSAAGNEAMHNLAFDAGVKEALADIGTPVGHVTSATGGTSSIIVDDDGDTKVDVEASADEDVIRFDAGGAEVATIGNAGQLALPIIGAAAGLLIGDDSKIYSPTLKDLTFDTRVRLDGTITDGAKAVMFIGADQNPVGRTMLDIRIDTDGADTDLLNVTDTGILGVDTINEITPEAGVTIEGVQLKDGVHAGSAHVRPYTYSITFGWDPQSPQVFAP
jgi:hypothetical protein